MITQGADSSHYTEAAIEMHIPVDDVHTMDLECLLEESSMVDLDIGDQTKDSKENLVFDLRHLVTVQKICTSRFD